MSTLEYGRYTGPPLDGDRLARCLIDLQDSTVRKHHFRGPSLSVADYEDLYARAILLLLERHPDASFPAPQAVVSWLDTTISRSAIDILRRRNLGRETNEVVSVTDSRRSDDEPNVVQPVDSAPTPEQYVLLDEDSLTLKEFIASLDPEDRKISLLHLHPGSRMKLKQIAQALDLPAPQVNTVLKRVDKRFSRYIALEVDAVCELRARDVARWKRTGEMPAALRWHARRCSTCSAKIEAARNEVYRSLLPVAGAVGLPAGGSFGFVSRIYHRVGSHPAVVRANEELSRGRKVGAVGAGGGGALISAKAILVGAVGAVAAAGAGVAVVHSIGTGAPAPRTPVAQITATGRIGTVKTGSARLIVGRQSATTTRTTTTNAKTTTNPKTKTTSPKRPATTRHTSLGAKSSGRVVSSTQTTSPTEATATSSPPLQSTSASPPSTRRRASNPTTNHTNSSTASGGSGGLPDLKQTEQQP